MKALILAGGSGSRLRPFSHSTPKQLVPVANKPVIFHALEAIAETGITEVGVIVSGEGEAVKAAVGTGARFGLAVTYLSQDRPRGLAHCVLIAGDFLGDEDFLMFLGDNVFVGGITAPMAEFRARRPAAQLVVTKVADPSQYGIAEVDDDGRVTGLQEKPKQARSDLAVTGVYFFTPRIHEAVASIGVSARGELEITDAVQALVDGGHEVRARFFSGYWKDTGTLVDLLACNRALLGDIRPETRGSIDARTELIGLVRVEEGARVSGSRIIGPAVIGAGSTVTDSSIGAYTSLGEGCRVEDAEIENSILLDRASVRGVRPLRGSIIGRDGEVRRSEAGAVRLLVGDDSKVEVLR